MAKDGETSRTLAAAATMTTAAATTDAATTGAAGVRVSEADRVAWSGETGKLMTWNTATIITSV